MASPPESPPLAVPRVYVRVIRWAEALFIVPALFMLAFLPIPPHGPEVVSFVILSSGILGAGFVWWGLRSPTRLAWDVAILLAGAWSALWLRNVGALVINIFSGHAEPGVVLSYLIASSTFVAQLIVLVAWLLVRVTQQSPRS